MLTLLSRTGLLLVCHHHQLVVHLTNFITTTSCPSYPNTQELKTKVNVLFTEVNEANSSSFSFEIGTMKKTQREKQEELKEKLEELRAKFTNMEKGFAEWTLFRMPSRKQSMATGCSQRGSQALLVFSARRIGSQMAFPV
ncbi:unnamed protein product [Orchesella dallaii]|uniref:Uncharacterized protein n=1 Tax=Orchesella dallaii TaxID=48710 RepID=A0ABP1RN46_9HEXA